MTAKSSRKLAQAEKKIPIAGPSITQKEADYVADAVLYGHYENAGKHVAEFERKFSDYIGVAHAIATNSCTASLHLALLALGIGPGDEVIVPEITWISSASAVSYVGAKPIFADIESDTWCIDPTDFEKKITKRTRVVIPVHVYGHPAEMREILAIAKKNKLFVIEDAAQSVGSEYFGKKTGSFGHFAAFSFYGTKLMTTGEGGILVTGQKRLYRRVKFLNSEAKDPKKTFWHLEIGTRYAMSNMQAAMGTAQLSRINQLLAKKRRIFNWYKKRLGKIDGITMNIEKDGCKNNFWMTNIILDKRFKLRKEKLMKKLAKYNIDSRPFMYPLSSMPPFKPKADNPVAYSISADGLTLPSAFRITEDEVDYVCKTLKAILGL